MTEDEAAAAIAAKLVGHFRPGQRVRLDMSRSTGVGEDLHGREGEIIGQASMGMWRVQLYGTEWFAMEDEMVLI